MTAAHQPELHFPSTPVAGPALSVITNVAESAPDDYRAFEAACRAVGSWSQGVVDPNQVRQFCKDAGMRFKPKEYASFWTKGCSAAGFMDKAEWTVNSDAKGRNSGKPIRLRKIRTTAP